VDEVALTRGEYVRAHLEAWAKAALSDEDRPASIPAMTDLRATSEPRVVELAGSRPAWFTLQITFGEGDGDFGEDVATHLTERLRRDPPFGARCHPGAITVGAETVEPGRERKGVRAAVTVTVPDSWW
jgi:hypothetical protein